MVGGTFAVIALVGRTGDIRHSLSDYRGLAKDRPVLALALVVFRLAQAGVPLTSGFFGKFYVQTCALPIGSTWLAVFAMVSTVISAFLYLRIIVAMYMETDADGDDAREVRRFPIPFTAGLGVAFAVAVTLVVGIFPSVLADPAGDATPALLEEVPPEPPKPASPWNPSRPLWPRRPCNERGRGAALRGQGTEPSVRRSRGARLGGG